MLQTRFSMSENLQCEASDFFFHPPSLPHHRYILSDKYTWLVWTNTSDQIWQILDEEWPECLVTIDNWYGFIKPISFAYCIHHVECGHPLCHLDGFVLIRWKPPSVLATWMSNRLLSEQGPLDNILACRANIVSILPQINCSKAEPLVTQLWFPQSSSPSSSSPLSSSPWSLSKT